jgi:hypothetical protein
MNLAYVENLQPRFRSRLVKEPGFVSIIDAIEGSSREEWFKLIGQFELLCRLNKPPVEAVVPRIRALIAAIRDKKLRDECMQLAGQYCAIIVRAELGLHNAGRKGRVSELCQRGELFIDPSEARKPRRTRRAYRKAHLTRNLDKTFLRELETSAPPAEAAEFDNEMATRR